MFKIKQFKVSLQADNTSLYSIIYIVVYSLLGTFKKKKNNNFQFHVFAFYTIKHFFNQLRQYISQNEALRFSEPTVN